MIAAANQSKLIPVTATALVTTFALFYLMQSLVATDSSDYPEPRTPFRLDVNFGEIKTEPVRKIDRLPPPPPVEEVPEIEIERIPQGGGTQLQLGPAPKFSVQASGDTRPNLGFSDGERLPLVRVTPVYPRRALERGVEGWVLVEFTVTEMGSVIEAKVLEADPIGYFERSALNAIKKFKYKPTVVDGEARVSRGNRYRMTFELTENR